MWILPVRNPPTALTDYARRRYKLLYVLRKVMGYQLSYQLIIFNGA
jgi:hypothetical protein